MRPDLRANTHAHEGLIDRDTRSQQFSAAGVLYKSQVLRKIHIRYIGPVDGSLMCRSCNTTSVNCQWDAFSFWLTDKGFVEVAACPLPLPFGLEPDTLITNPFSISRDNALLIAGV